MSYDPPAYVANFAEIAQAAVRRRDRQHRQHREELRRRAADADHVPDRQARRDRQALCWRARLRGAAQAGRAAARRRPERGRRVSATRRSACPAQRRADDQRRGQPQRSPPGSRPLVSISSTVGSPAASGTADARSCAQSRALERRVASSVERRLPSGPRPHQQQTSSASCALGHDRRLESVVAGQRTASPRRRRTRADRRGRRTARRAASARESVARDRAPRRAARRSPTTRPRSSSRNADRRGRVRRRSSDSRTNPSAASVLPGPPARQRSHEALFRQELRKALIGAVPSLALELNGGAPARTVVHQLQRAAQRGHAAPVRSGLMRLALSCAMLPSSTEH